MLNTLINVICDVCMYVCEFMRSATIAGRKQN